MSPLYEGEVKTVHQPGGGKFVGDVDLHFDADRLLFSSHRDMSELSVPDGPPGCGDCVRRLGTLPSRLRHAARHHPLGR